MRFVRRAQGLLFVGVLCGTTSSWAQEAPTAAELAAANNPLANMKAFNLQNYYIPKLTGMGDEVANNFWFRYAAPTGPVLWRASLPLVTVPGATANGDPVSGVGDLQIFGAYLAVQRPDLTFGIGPQMAFPSASEEALGSGKYQLGFAAVAFAVPSPTWQLGGLVTWQASIAGEDDRADTSVLAVQPFSFWQLGGGTYLRTAPIWAFDLRSGNYNVPFGFGMGKVVKVGSTVFNILLDPQFTILHDGIGQPGFQVFTALNMQFTSK